MEFDKDLFAIQRVLSSCNSIGPLKNIRHVGGNETKISLIVEDVRTVLVQKGYASDDGIDPSHDKEIFKIILYLILNTDFNDKTTLIQNEAWCPFVGSCPELSKCLLVSLIWGLKLGRFYAEALYSLPMAVSVQMADCFNRRLQDAPLEVLFEQTNVIAYAIFVKVVKFANKAQPCKVEMGKEKAEKLLERAYDAFSDATGHYESLADYMAEASWSLRQKHQFLGRGILRLLGLVKHCLAVRKDGAASVPVSELLAAGEFECHGDAESELSAAAVEKCVGRLYSVCTAGLMLVSVDVFCSWVEFGQSPATLQQKIGRLAFELVPELEADPKSEQLPQMVSSIAVRPLSAAQLAAAADRETVFSEVLKRGPDCSAWLKALLKMHVFEDGRALEVLQAAADLCSPEDLAGLLAQLPPDRPDARQALLACAGRLAEPQLAAFLQEALQRRPALCAAAEGYEQRKNQVFNRISARNGDTDGRQLLLLLLEDSADLLATVHATAANSVQLARRMAEVLLDLKPVLDARPQLLADVLQDFLRTQEFSRAHLQSLKEFADQLEGLRVFSDGFVLGLVQIVALDEEDCMERRFVLFNVWNHLLNDQSLACKSDKLETCNKLVNLLPKYRWNISSYAEEKAELLPLILQLLNKLALSLTSEESQALATNVGALDKCYLAQTTPELFFSAVFPSFDANNQSLCTAVLMKLLLESITEELSSVVSVLVQKTDCFATLRLLTDTMLILAQVYARSSDSSVQLCLNSCWSKFLYVLKNCICPSLTTTNQQQKMMKAVLSMLKHMPKAMQNSSDLLLNIFDEEALKGLAKDRAFEDVLAPLENLTIHTLICSKMLN